jgi:hypothetical protein
VTTVPARSVTPQPANASGHSGVDGPTRQSLPRFLTEPYQLVKRLVDDARSRYHNDVALWQVLGGRFIRVQRAARGTSCYEHIDVIGSVLDLRQDGPEWPTMPNVSAGPISKTYLRRSLCPIRLCFIVYGVGRGGPLWPPSEGSGFSAMG